MLLLHELHEVVGSRETDFEAHVRDGWMPSLAEDPGTRLVYFMHHAVGTGPSYHVVTVTALEDAAAWGRLAARVETGDLRAWAVEADSLRHDVRAKLLTPLPWSPLQRLDLAALPTEPIQHELGLFMEDTVWPDEGRLEDYVAASGDHYAEEMRERGREGNAILRIEASYRTAFGSHVRREVVLWQRVVQPKALLGLLTTEIPARFKQPGTWMHDALALRDRWQSRLLRTSSWSPLY